MDFHPPQNVLPSSQPVQQPQEQAQESLPSVIPFVDSPRTIDNVSSLASGGLEGENSHPITSSPSHESGAVTITTPLLDTAQAADPDAPPYDVRQSLYVDPSSIPPEPSLNTVKPVVKSEGVDDGGACYTPRHKRRHTAKSAASTAVENTDTSEGIADCGNTVGVYSGNSEEIYPRKARAGLRKSTETRKNNNRVALRDFTSGRRCVTDVKPIETPMVLRLKVVNGVSTERVLRKNRKSILLDVGQRFGVLQLFVEGHPKPDEKVWVTTEKGAVPVPSVAVEHTMASLTIDMREFPIIARGKVRRDPQKQGTRPKAGEPIIDCYAIFVGDEGRPLWVDSSLVTPEQIRVVQPQPIQSVLDQSQQITMSQIQPAESSQQMPSDPSIAIPDQREEDQPQVPQS